LTETPPIALTLNRPNQSRLRRNSGSHPLIKSTNLSKQTEPLQFLADNRASVMVNGIAIASTLNAEAPEPLTNRYGFLAGSMGTFSYTIPAGGIHTVTIRVRNSDMATGMIAEVTATRTCKEPAERARP
jgi:hypothetical protein